MLSQQALIRGIMWKMTQLLNLLVWSLGFPAGFLRYNTYVYIYTYTRSPHIYRPFSHRIFTARIHLHRACLAVESTVSSVSSSRSTQTTMQNASKCHFKWIQMAHTLIFRSLNQLAILVKLHYHSRLLGPALGCSRHQESKAIVL